jgi:hypothetical protein
MVIFRFRFSMRAKRVSTSAVAPATDAEGLKDTVSPFCGRGNGGTGRTWGKKGLEWRHLYVYVNLEHVYLHL